jgi:hypothetical protein
MKEFSLAINKGLCFNRSSMSKVKLFMVLSK